MTSTKRKLPLAATHSHTSSNIETYRLHRGTEWWGLAEVLIDSLERVDGRYRRRRPAHYYLTIYHRPGQGGLREVARITYRPKNDPPGLHLPDRTVTRLVRNHGL